MTTKKFLYSASAFACALQVCVSSPSLAMEEINKGEKKSPSVLLSSSSSSSSKPPIENDSRSSRPLPSNPVYREMLDDALSENGKFRGLRVTNLLNDILITYVIPYLQECPYLGNKSVPALNPWFLTYPVTITLHIDPSIGGTPIFNCAYHRNFESTIKWGHQSLEDGNSSYSSFYGSSYQPNGQYKLSVPEYAVQSIDRTPEESAHCLFDYSSDSSSSLKIEVAGETSTEHDLSSSSIPNHIRFWNKKKQPLVDLSATIDPMQTQCIIKAMYKETPSNTTSSSLMSSSSLSSSTSSSSMSSSSSS